MGFLSDLISDFKGTKSGGERTPNYPGPGYAQQQGSYGAPQQGGYGYGQGGYNNQGAAQQHSYDPTRSSAPEEQKKSGGNGLKYAAVGAAGLAGGALLMHESDKIGEGFDSAKQGLENAPENVANWTGEQVGRAEHTYDNAVDDVENFPENAARWTGDKVQAVEDIPENIENKWDNMVDGVEDFGDNMENAYDEGRDERRYEDEDDY
ncbi:hypothetical protein PtrSN002B_008325 [Pyrenophora tritici-repentis]|nr:hypothetical protein A1F94_009150 [Pyrenophora tritici-repentis]KAI0569773.1 hypothetical protein Alg215_11443 [Pyrenophora tritici-repentis]KAI0570711.1 hypothetical protein Alg130_11130 [Pyrenophora tritici-repentis]KAI0604417.1 hypothetical protein TUN205_11337 [Pyrenophora tritici-repentis]KAI0616931.1 hypothetical protein TUN199_11076 [Pyrenophora tritici-repentis]